MKLRIIESTSSEHIDIDVVHKCFRDIAFFRSISKTLHKGNTIEREVVKKKLKSLREELKNYVTMCYKVKAENKRSYYWELYTNQPTISELKEFRKAFKSRVKEARAELKKEIIDEKELLGFKYNTIGGVLTEPGTIVNLLQNTDPVQRVRSVKKPTAISKNNYVGVEIEMICIATKETLETALIQHGLAGFVRVGTDGSIKTDNSSGVREYTWELTVMCKQEDLKYTFNKLNKVLNLNYIKAYVNNSCGLHVHIDCRNRDHIKVYRNLVNALPVLKGMVPHERVTSPHALQYCSENKTNKYVDAVGHRYQMVNPDAYNKYKTIEVRLHSGSTNAIKIVNWASLLVAIAEGDLVDRVTDINDLSSKISLPNKLVEYIIKRTDIFKARSIMDTRQDHDSTITFEMAV